MTPRRPFAAQQGYFLMIAVILILVIGLLGSIIAYLLTNRAQLGALQYEGLSAFYTAETGLERATRMLTMPSVSGTPARIACSGVTGSAALTNSAFGSGALTVTTINSSPIWAITSLNGSVSAAGTSISVSNAAGFASTGRLMIEREAVDYGAISGNTFTLVTRGVAGTTAASHAGGAPVSQYQCSIDVQAGIPNPTSPRAQRELQWHVPLQDGWMAGNRSGNSFVLLNWNRLSALSWSDSFTSGSPSTRANLRGISMLSNAYGWAVGEMANSSFTLLSYSGSGWTLNALSGACSGQHLLGVSMVTATEAWAVGARFRDGCASSGPYRYTVLQWNGGSWSKLAPTTIPADNDANQNLNSVHVVDPAGSGAGTVGFAVGDDGQILQYNGSTWAAVASSTSQNLMGVYTVSSIEAFAVGASGTILRWNGSGWGAMSSPTSTTLNAVAMIDTDGDGLANAGWAVGNSGVIATYNGSSWSATTSGSANLLGVSIFNARDVWAVGASGNIRHYDGDSWSAFSTSGSRQYNAISVISPGTKQTVGWQQVFH